MIALKQGAGRLIRGAEDRGVLVVCDPRLLGRSYGHSFLASLPPMRRTRELDEVRARRDAALADVSAREAMAAADTPKSR